MYIFRWDIKSARYSSTNEIRQVEWMFTAINDVVNNRISTYMEGTTSLSSGSNTIDYNDVTEENIISWIEAVEDMDQLRSTMTKKLDDVVLYQMLTPGLPTSMTNE